MGTCGHWSDNRKYWCNAWRPHRRNVTFSSALSLYTMNLFIEVQNLKSNCKQICWLERKMVSRRVPSGPFHKPWSKDVQSPNLFGCLLGRLSRHCIFFKFIKQRFLRVMYSRPERRLSWIFGLFNKVISTSNRTAGLFFFIYLTMISQIHKL